MPRVNPTADPRIDLRLFGINRIKDITKALFELRNMPEYSNELAKMIVKAKDELCNELDEHMPIILNENNGGRSHSRSRSRRGQDSQRRHNNRNLGRGYVALSHTLRASPSPGRGRRSQRRTRRQR
jgi:hypothetical protein